MLLTGNHIATEDLSAVLQAPSLPEPLSAGGADRINRQPQPPSSGKVMFVTPIRCGRPNKITRPATRDRSRLATNHMLPPIWPRLSPAYLFSFPKASCASLISVLPGLSESAQIVSSSLKYWRLKSPLPLSCAACAAPYNDRNRRGSSSSAA
jgi:hypothetical protein